VALLVGILNGVSAAIVVIIIGVGTGLSFGPLQAVPTASRLVDLANSTAYIGIFALFGIVGAYGAFVRFVPGRLHILLRLLVAVILSLGVLGTQPKPSLLMVLVIGCIYVLTLYSAVVGRGEAARMYRSLSQGETQIMRAGLFGIAGLLLLSLPILLGSYLTSIINLVGLYVILGVGLGVVVGDAGLLNLGYVAFMAIGAYVTGLLTTPTLLTCGGLTPPALQSDALSVACPGLMSFWQAAPLAVGGSTLAGLIVGLSALHVRGEHLAIVTLGFGEIARIVLRADDFRGLFGAAQGITGVTRPILDLTALNPAWRVRLDSEGAMYYLILGCIVLVIFVAFRLRHSRIGRAWRAMRADEVVAQAMGVHVSRAKLLAFVLGAACAGLAGAIQTVRLYGAYPDSFTLQVTISVLALVMIAGAGSITGVIVGALLLIGLPELLRELIDYRLLAFGVLLIAAMWLYPGTMLTRGRVWKRSK
jgi:branched-chain amino acid transport system permease protein